MSDKEKMDSGYIFYNKKTHRYDQISWTDLAERTRQEETEERTQRWLDAEQRIQSRLRERDVISGYHIEDPWGWLFNAK